MSAHAERAYPEECCGLLVGQMKRQWEGAYTSWQVSELVPLENRWNAEAAFEGDAMNSGLTKSRRYSIDPADMLRSQKQARAQGLNIIGIYHSHPDHVAEPSECDRIQAWPDYLYSIVSVVEGQTVNTLHWTLDSNHQFQLVTAQISSLPNHHVESQLG